LYNCTFRDNSGARHGGAIKLAGNPINFQANDSFFYRNQAEYGGAFSFVDGTVSLVNTKFIENTASQNGGAFYSNQSQAGSIFCDSNPNFNLNTATNGGAFGLLDSTITAQGCVFFFNNATLNGKAIEVHNSTVSFTKMQFNTNRASTGGAIDFTGSFGMISSSNFSTNWASEAGAIHVEHQSDVLIINSIFSMNNAFEVNGSAIFVSEQSSFSGNQNTFISPITGIIDQIYCPSCDLPCPALHASCIDCPSSCWQYQTGGVIYQVLCYAYNTSEPNSCQNGGNCLDYNLRNLECECPSDYSGSTCQTFVNPHKPPKKNGLTGGQKAGIVIAVFVVVILAAIGGIAFYRRRLAMDGYRSVN